MKSIPRISDEDEAAQRIIEYCDRKGKYDTIPKLYSVFITFNLLRPRGRKVPLSAVLKRASFALSHDKEIFNLKIRTDKRDLLRILRALGIYSVPHEDAPNELFFDRRHLMLLLGGARRLTHDHSYVPKDKAIRNWSRFLRARLFGSHERVIKALSGRRRRH